MTKVSSDLRQSIQILVSTAKEKALGKISCSEGGKYEDDSFLGYSSV
jgi:hypothetical protein